MIWTLTSGETAFPISDGLGRIFKLLSKQDVGMQQTTQVVNPLRAAYAVAYPDRATRVLSFDLTATFPPCATHEEAFAQSLDIPTQCPRGGVLTGQLGATLRTYTQAWVNAIKAEQMGLTNVFTFSVSAVNPSTATLSRLAQMNPNAVANLDDISTLTGGGATALDSLATADVAAGFQADLFVLINGLHVLATFRLYAGTDATNTDPDAGPVIVRPVDYNGSTNAKVWKRLDS